MGITDELREYVSTADRDVYTGKFLAIADRIDEKLAERYVELPKDADGEPIHIGDVMEDGLDQAFTPKKVKMLMLEDNEWMLNFGGGWSVMKHHEWHHYHAPTVEDVLHEFASAYDRIGGEDEEHQKYLNLIAEYAKRLRLAGSDVE